MDAMMTSARAAAINEAEINQALEAAIDPWLEHMRWRADFAEWRERRLWQERRQQGTLNNLRAFLQAAGQANGNGSAHAAHETGDARTAHGATLNDVLAGRLILDLGCGMGGLTTALALAGASVQPLDYNEHYCQITRLRGLRYGLNFAPVNAAGEALPFPDEHFDVIMCMDVLEHVQDPEKLLAEISRCLKRGGLCQLTAINRFAFRDPHYHVRFVNWLPRRFADSYLRLVGRAKDNSRFADRQTLREMHYYTYGGLARLLARHGLTGVVEAGELKLQRRRRGWKGLLQRSGMMGFAHKTYRHLYQSTYVVMAVKG